jgi:hypothetical protein
MIAWLAARLVAWSVPARAARPIAWAILLLALGLLLWGAWSLWLDRHDARVVEADRSATTAQVLGNVVAADRGAGAAKDARDRAFQNEQSNLQEKADAAAGNGASPLDALFDELR